MRTARRLSIAAIPVLLLATACGSGSAGGEPGYYQDLQQQQAESIDDGESLARAFFAGYNQNAPAEEWQPMMSQFYRDYATLLDGVADGMAQLDPPSEAEELHDDFVVGHRSLAVELRELADDLGPGDTIDVAMGGMASAFTDLLGPPCAELQRVALQDGGETIDLRCP